VPTRYPPNDPREWINRAQSNLAIAQTQGQDVYFEDLCFNAQQAIEVETQLPLIEAIANILFTSRRCQVCHRSVTLSP
jgi:HEPN domain-containing protein